MSTSGRQLRSSSRAPSVGPSVVPDTPAARARRTPSKAGSKAGGSVAGRNEVDPRVQDSYGSRGPDTTATRLGHQNTLQQIESQIASEINLIAPAPTAPTIAASVTSSRRTRRHTPDPSEQLSAIEEISGNDTANQVNDITDNEGNSHHLDGATLRQTPAHNRVNTRLQNEFLDVDDQIETSHGFVDTVRKWLGSILLVLLAIACLAPVAYHGSMAGARPTSNTGLEKKIAAIVADKDSLVQRVDASDIYYRDKLEFLEHRILDITNEQEITNVENKYKLDWLDPRNNAVTMPFYTSPEKMRTVSGWMGIFTEQVPLKAYPRITGPFADVKKSWCAPSTEGKAQVTVFLPKHITPRVLVVEQAGTMDQVLDYATYPKQIELWARIDLNYNPSRNYDFAPDADKFQGKELAPAQALPKDFHLIGRWEYKLGTNLAKQSFNVPIEVVSDMVAVRVNSNWGNAEQTCLHKLQLFGDDAGL